MSFSSDIKAELARKTGLKRHCQVSLFAAILSGTGLLKALDDGNFSIVLLSDNEIVREVYIDLLERLFKIEVKDSDDEYIEISDKDQVEKILKLTKAVDENGYIVRPDLSADPEIAVKSCCKRAFLKGAFLVSGSVNNPEKSYHFEIVCKDEYRAKFLQDILNEFDLDAKTVSRGNKTLVYIKEGEKIADALGYIGADVSMLSMENTRILKEMRGNVNRAVNCETANIAKVVNAAHRQVEDIRYIEEHGGLKQLSDGLLQMAEIRLEYPEASLIELGEMLNPPVGKSGVNHRLRRISEFAEKLGRER